MNNEQGITGKPFVDEPHQMVIELDQPLTCEQANELGKVLGMHGFTGTFIGGDVATLCGLGAEYRRQQSHSSRDKKQGA